jgi:hypothetical protein
MAIIESRINIFHLANLILCKGISGDFVEVGCNASKRNLYAFDSFESVSDTASPDEGLYNKGDMTASLGKFNSNFEKASAIGIALGE